MDAKTNDASCILIHRDQYPVRLQQNRFTSKQIDTPQTIFQMADEREPGRTVVRIGFRMVMFREDKPDDIFVDVSPKRSIDLLRDPWATVLRISAFHFNDGFGEFWRWTLGSRFALILRGLQPLILAFYQRIVASQKR